MNRLIGRVLAIGLVCAFGGAASAYAAPTALNGGAGRLDPNFADRGKLTLGTEEAAASEFPRTTIPIASGPRGGLVVADGRTIVRLRADGLFDREFGENGWLTIKPPTGSSFSLNALAIDPQGRVLVAGTTSSLTATTPAPPLNPDPPGPFLSQATVYRFLPDGRLDPEFGEGGVVSSTFGQPTPTDPFGDRYGLASVRGSAISIDRSGRIVVGGLYVSHVGGGCFAGYFAGPAYMTHAYVARLNPDGTHDLGFADLGATTDEQIDRLWGLAAAPTGQVAYAGSSGGECGVRGKPEETRLVSLLGDGALNQGFGSGGGLPQPQLRVRALALDRRGRMVIVGNSGPEGEERPKVKRILPNGSPDPSFGNHGASLPRLPSSGIELVGLAIDRQGRPLLSGRTPVRDALRPDDQTYRFVMMRLTATGRVDRSFGRGGIVQTGFGSRTSSSGNEVVVDRRGRAVIAGPLKSAYLPNGFGVGLARYLLPR